MPKFVVEDTFIGYLIRIEGRPLSIVKGIKVHHHLQKYRKYIAECSVCSQDKELWPYGSIYGTKESLKHKGCPCNCRRFTAWKEWQNEIRVRRECEKRGYVFHGWFGEYKGSVTLLDLENPKTSNRWQSATIDSFLSGQGDKIESNIRNSIKRRKADQDYIKDFIASGKFLEGTKFIKADDNLGSNRRWLYICPVCSYDEYVDEGLCSGVFEGDVSSFKKGHLACRCSKYCRWTQDQREYQIKLVMKDEGISSDIKWNEPYKNGKARFEYDCTKDHKHRTSVNDFLNGHRCRCKSITGFNVKKKGTFYIVEWYGFGESFIKIGITNNKVIDRITDQHRKSKLDYKILFFTDYKDGKVIYELENYIKKGFCNRYGHKIGMCKKDWLSDGYTETFENSDKLLSDLYSVLIERGFYGNRNKRRL